MRFSPELDEAGVARVMPYTLLSGVSSASPFWQMLQHVVNHASYHRGQVTTMLRQLGAAPAKSCDMITFYRERVPIPRDAASAATISAMNRTARFLAIGAIVALASAEPRAPGAVAGSGPAQHHPDSGRRPRLRRSQRLRSGAVRDARHRSARARGHPLHEVLLGQHRLRAVARGADDGPAHRPRLDSRQRRDPAAAGGRDRRHAAARRRLSHRGHRQVGPGHARARPGSRTRRASTTRSASSIIVTRIGSTPITCTATARARADRSQSRLRERPVHAAKPSRSSRATIRSRSSST